jgi:hypothetical protein
MGLPWISWRFEIGWEKMIAIEGFYPFRLFAFSPFRSKIYPEGPHMARSRYQKEGRCVT